jgi:hypothetical protein
MDLPSPGASRAIKGKSLHNSVNDVIAKPQAHLVRAVAGRADKVGST